MTLLTLLTMEFVLVVVAYDAIGATVTTGTPAPCSTRPCGSGILLEGDFPLPLLGLFELTIDRSGLAACPSNSVTIRRDGC